MLSAVAAALCAAASMFALTAGSAAAATPELPDGRGYEMVSPVSDADGDVYEPTLEGLNGDGVNGYSTERPFQAAAGGAAVAYVGDPSAQGGTGSEGKGAGNEYLATRALGVGWSALNIEPPSATTAEGEAVFQGFSSDLSVGILDWDGQVPLTAGAPGGGYHVLYARTAAGAYHSLFTTTPHLTPAELKVTFAGASANFEDLLFMANDALTPEALAGGAGENNLYDSVDGQLRSVNVLAGKADPNATFGAPPQGPGEPPDFSHVISADGSRIFWTALDTGELYVREHGETTVQVSAGAAQFQTATADGRYVFYTEGERLYQFDVATEARDELAGAGVEGVIGVGGEGESEDGAYVYYVANDDLYVLHEGQAAHLIAQLSAADGSDWSPGLADRTAQVTPDGEHLVFVSRRNLTGYENAGHTEVYLYDARSTTQPEALRCVACEPSGEPPTGGSEYSAVLQPGHSNTYVPRWVSQDGGRVFFDSLDALVPQNSNGRLDVYEWERDGVGSCAQSQGCIFPLSGGTSTDNSYFIDASSSGDDVFILTREQLTPEDPGEAFVLYDARVGASSEATVSTACTGSGCQGEPSPPLNLSTPASVTFEGLGNLPPTAAAPSGSGKGESKPLTRAQKLARALKACRSRHNKQRAACEVRARKQYGARSTAKRSANREGS